MWLDKLREMKSASGLTTREIAVRSGIPEPTLEKVFAGKTKDPKLETIRQLVYSFGCTLDDLDDKPAKKSPDTTEAVPEDAQEKEFMRLVRALTPDQKDFLLAVLKTLLERGK